MNPVRRFQPGTSFHWEDVDTRAYKAEGAAPFKDVTRQVLFGGADLAGELRYFEMHAGGWSTLERHEHVHAVMILRGSGQCLVGSEIYEVGRNDLVTVPPLTWHQFKAGAAEPLGFLCMVDARRDRPQLPSEKDLGELRADPLVAAFISV